jgi:hypothetical protein
MLNTKYTTLKERLTCFIVYDLTVYTYVLGRRLKCKLGIHDLSGWNYPTKFSKPYYIGKTKWRYCVNNCGHQKTVIDMRSEVYQ